MRAKAEETYECLEDYYNNDTSIEPLTLPYIKEEAERVTVSSHDVFTELTHSALFMDAPRHDLFIATMTDADMQKLRRQCASKLSSYEYKQVLAEVCWQRCFGEMNFNRR